MFDDNEFPDDLPPLTDLDKGETASETDGAVVLDGRVFVDLDAFALVLHSDVHQSMSMASILPEELLSILGIPNADNLAGQHEVILRLHGAVDSMRHVAGLPPLAVREQPDGPPSEDPETVSMLENMFNAGGDDDNA